MSTMETELRARAEVLLDALAAKDNHGDWDRQVAGRGWMKVSEIGAELRSLLQHEGEAVAWDCLPYDLDGFCGCLNVFTGEWWPAVGNADEEAANVVELAESDILDIVRARLPGGPYLRRHLTTAGCGAGPQGAHPAHANSPERSGTRPWEL